MKNLVIVGAGGHAGVIVDCVEANASFNIVCLLNPDPSANKAHGYRVASTFDTSEDLSFIIAVGDNRARKCEFDLALSRGWQPATIIHPSAVIAKNVRLGAGTVVLSGAIVTNGATIGDNCIINTGATVDHNCNIANHCHVAPGCHLSGGVHMGEGAFLGIGAIAIPNMSIGEWASVGAGSVIVSAIPARAKAVGVPARITKKG